MNITVYDNPYIQTRVDEYHRSHSKNGGELDDAISNAEVYSNGYEAGKDIGFFDGYLQCLKDLGIRQ